MDDQVWLDAASPAEATAALLRCCGSASWAKAMVASRPFRTSAELFSAAEREWAKASLEDKLEAFSQHPRIGDRDSLRARFPNTHAWAAAEQSGADRAEDGVLDALAKGNLDYEARFGYTFIVSASGKTAAEMLDLLRARLKNKPEGELKIAAAEQMKITRLRLEKLVQDRWSGGGARTTSPITTHVLDTSIGKPAATVGAKLEQIAQGVATPISSRATNADGRIGDLLEGALSRGRYRITFDTGAYFASRGVPCFFPEVAIEFEITDETQHHHVPLLLSPFGYSTYRGS